MIGDEMVLRQGKTQTVLALLLLVYDVLLLVGRILILWNGLRVNILLLLLRLTLNHIMLIRLHLWVGSN